VNSTDSIVPHCFIGEVGVAQLDITPPLGIYSRCWGAAKFDCASGIHREQKLTVILIKSKRDSEPLLLVNLEVPWMDEDAWRSMLDKAVHETALQSKPERIIMNVSHNHSSAPIETIESHLEGSELIQIYKTQVVNTLAEAIQMAKSKCCRAQITADTGNCNLARNRDLKIEEKGSVYCGFNPEKSADDTLLVMRITDLSNGSIMGTIVNYACHPTTLGWDNRDLSPDYIGAMRSLVESQTQAPCCLLQGASGELGARQGHQGDVNVADKQGRQLAYAVLSCLEGMIEHRQQIDFAGTIASGADLAYWKPVELKERLGMTKINAELVDFNLILKDDLPTAEAYKELYLNCEDRVQKERFRRRLKGRLQLGEGPNVLQKMWKWQIGSISFLASPFEWYSDFQMAVRSALPNEQIIICNLSNGNGSYLVPESMYGEVLYQKDISPFKKGCLEISIAAAIQSF